MQHLSTFGLKVVAKMEDADATPAVLSTAVIEGIQAEELTELINTALFRSESHILVNLNFWRTSHQEHT
jgi:hypothetical protein